MIWTSMTMSNKGQQNLLFKWWWDLLVSHLTIGYADPNFPEKKETNLPRFEEAIYLYRLNKCGSSIRDFICYRMPSTPFTIFRSWKIPCTMCNWSPCKFFCWTSLLHCRRVEWTGNLVHNKYCEESSNDHWLTASNVWTKCSSGMQLWAFHASAGCEKIK